MSARGSVIGSALRLRVLVASAGLLAVLLLVLAPGQLEGRTWKECIDRSFVDYNGCLVPTNSWFERKLCDIAWEFDVALCTAYIVGDIRKAYNQGSG